PGSVASSADRLQAQDRGQHGGEDDRGVAAVVVAAIALAAVIAVLVTAVEALAEVVLVVGPANVVVVVAVAGVDPHARVAVAAVPVAAAVGATCAQAFLVAPTHGLAQHVRAVAAGAVPLAAVTVTVGRHVDDAGVVHDAGRWLDHARVVHDARLREPLLVIA